MPYISPELVITVAPANNWAVKKMKQTLIKQGQIEPLQVKSVSDGVTYRTFVQDAWGDEIVYAARELGWETILVHITNRFEA